MRRIVFGLPLCILLFFRISSAQHQTGRQVIACSPSDSTTFFFTNKTTAFYYGEACRANTTPLQGLNVLTREYFEDYLLLFDGNALNRNTAEVSVYSDHLVRKYSPQQIVEEVFLLDSLNVLSIKVTSQVHGNLEFVPGFAGSRAAQDFETHWEREFGLLHVWQRGAMQNTDAGKTPARVALATRPAARFASYDDRQREAIAKRFSLPTFFPGSLQVALRDSALFYVVIGGDTKSLVTGLHSR